MRMIFFHLHVSRVFCSVFAHARVYVCVRARACMCECICVNMYVRTFARARACVRSVVCG